MDYVSQLLLFFQLHFFNFFNLFSSFIAHRILDHNVQCHSLRFEPAFCRFRSDGPCDQRREDRNENFIGELDFLLVTDY